MNASIPVRPPDTETTQDWLDRQQTYHGDCLKATWLSDHELMMHSQKALQAIEDLEHIYKLEAQCQPHKTHE